MNETHTLVEMNRIYGEAEATIKSFTDLKRERTEDIAGFIAKLQTLKETNTKLYEFKEHGLDKNARNKMIKKEGDLRN